MNIKYNSGNYHPQYTREMSFYWKIHAVLSLDIADGELLDDRVDHDGLRSHEQ